MSLMLYNTLSKQKEPFKPITENEVKMYLCGPTVYDLLHIGNFRGAIFFNLVRNWLESLGNKVTFVYNYTDVDDKIIKRARDEGVTSLEISERFIAEFEKDFQRLGLRSHDHNPKVTNFMPQIIDYVAKLIERKKAYVIDGEVFYEIETFDGYGKLSGKKIDELEAGQRVDIDQRKRSPYDFVLWKPSKEGEPSWDSPWGKGRPGWHIECSAMIHSILGETIDIHGGGIDLIFPHHENEIAQGEGATGCHYCNFWVHNNFINMKDQKMSKSLGNVIRAREFMDRYHPETLKYLMLSAHYRAMLGLGEDKVFQAISGLARVYTALEMADDLLKEKPGEVAVLSEKHSLRVKIREMEQSMTQALNDDFNTVEVFAGLFEVVRAFNALNLTTKKKTPETFEIAEFFASWIRTWGQKMALFQEGPTQILEALNTILVQEKNIDRAHVENLIKQRATARDSKDWALADKYRDELNGLGIDFKDGKEGTTWKVRAF